MSTAAPAHELTFADEAGAPTLVGHLVDVSVVGAAVRVTVEVDAATHDAATAAGLFHLVPLLCGPGAESFHPQGPIQIELELSPRLAPGLLAWAASPQAVQAVLTAGEPGSPLLAESAWYARAATWLVTDRPDDDDNDDDPATRLSEGYRTAWGSGPRDVPGLPLAAYLGEHLAGRGWAVDPLERGPGFRWETTGPDGPWSTVAAVDEHEGWCAAWSVLPREVASVDAADVALQLAEFNRELLFGTWQLTREPRQVQFRSSVELPDRTDAQAAIARLVERHLDIVADYYPTVVRDE